MLSAKENSQKVELHVSHLKSKQHIQVRSGGLCSTRPNRWEEDLLTTNQVPNIAARQDNIPRKSRETVIKKWFPESMVIAPSSGTSSGQQNDGSGVTGTAWFDPPHRHFYRHVILQLKHLQTQSRNERCGRRKFYHLVLRFFHTRSITFTPLKKPWANQNFFHKNIILCNLSICIWVVRGIIPRHLVLHTSY